MRMAALIFLLVACGHHDNASTPDGNGDGRGDDGDGRGSDNGDGGTGDAPLPATGELDPGFGSGGVVAVASEGVEHAWDLAIQPDGKVVVVGDAPGGILLLRFDADGSPDLSFGTQGRVAVGGLGAKAKGVALQSDGKIVITGENQPGATALARFDNTGALDPTFGTAGLSTPIQNTNGIGIGNDVSVRGDGTIVFCAEGIPEVGTINLAIVGRVSATGALDPSFGTNGYSTLTAQKGGGFNRLAIDSQQRILAIGTVYYSFASGNGHSWLLGRFQEDGALDNTFAHGALSIGDEDSYASDIAVQGDDKPVTMGFTASFIGSDGPHDLAHRTLLDGTEDDGYGTFGTRQWRSAPLAWVEGYAMALQSDGSTIMVGEGERFGTSSTIVVDATRLTMSGEIDSTFATSGSLVFEVPGGDAHPRAAAVASNGAVYIAGYVESGSTSHVFLARIH